MVSSASPAAARPVQYTAVLPRKLDPAGQAASWSKTELRAMPAARRDESSKTGLAARWLFETAPAQEARIAATFHQAAPQSQRTLFLSRKDGNLLLQRREERGSSGGVTITPSKVLWNGRELAVSQGNVDAPSSAEVRVEGRLRQALNGLQQRKHAPLAFPESSVPVVLAAPPMPAKPAAAENARRAVSAHAPAAAAPAQQVAKPLGEATLRQAFRFVKAGLPAGFDKVVEIDTSRAYRVKVGANWALTVEPVHLTDRKLVAYPKGTMVLDGKPVDEYSSRTTLRLAAERMNAALLAVEQHAPERLAALRPVQAPD